MQNIEHDIECKHYFKMFAMVLHLAIVSIILVKNEWLVRLFE